jgi:hypothetical protein
MTRVADRIFWMKTALFEQNPTVVKFFARIRAIACKESACESSAKVKDSTRNRGLSCTFPDEAGRSDSGIAAFQALQLADGRDVLGLVSFKGTDQSTLAL